MSRGRRQCHQFLDHSRFFLFCFFCYMFLEWKERAVLRPYKPHRTLDVFSVTALLSISSHRSLKAISSSPSERARGANRWGRGSVILIAGPPEKQLGGEKKNRCRRNDEKSCVTHTNKTSTCYKTVTVNYMCSPFSVFGKILSEWPQHGNWIQVVHSSISCLLSSVQCHWQGEKKTWNKTSSASHSQAQGWPHGLLLIPSDLLGPQVFVQL